MSADNWRDCPSCKRADVFREDYDIGVWSGNFEIDYSGYCDKCDFTIRYRYKKDAIEQGLITETEVPNGQS